MDSLLDFDRDLLAPPWGALGRDAVLGCVAAASKLVLNLLNTTTALNHQQYTQLVTQRPPGVGLLTVSNHTTWVSSLAEATEALWWGLKGQPKGTRGEAPHEHHSTLTACRPACLPPPSAT